ncbi:MAG: hypothetical protein ABI203_03390 [Mucilaginibacter sp.]
MKILLQADSVVSNGFYFKAIFNWWEITLIIILIVFVIYFIKRRRK